jgi:hypothetical protein
MDPHGRALSCLKITMPNTRPRRQTTRPHWSSVRPVMPPNATWARSGILRLASPPPWCWGAAAAPWAQAASSAVPAIATRRTRARSTGKTQTARRCGLGVPFMSESPRSLGIRVSAALRQSLPNAHISCASQAFRARLPLAEPSSSLPSHAQRLRPRHRPPQHREQ